jgi:hypothetical protein
MAGEIPGQGVPDNLEGMPDPSKPTLADTSETLHQRGVLPAATQEYSDLFEDEWLRQQAAAGNTDAAHILNFTRGKGNTGGAGGL